MSAHQALTPEAHRDLRVRTVRGAAFGDAVMSTLVVPDEFRQVQNDYPILFRLNDERDRFDAYAIFGFEPGENLFLDDTRWDAPHRPLTIDIQPFLIGRSTPGADDAQVHVDTASPRIAQDAGEEAIRVFDRSGAPTPYLDRIAERLGALHAGFREAPAFFAALARHDLLEPLTLEATLVDGSTARLVGFHAIDEARLCGLDPAEVGALHAEGHLMPIFMALASLANLGKLVERRNWRLRGG